MYLKLTFLNPHASSDDIDALLDTIDQAGPAEARASSTGERTRTDNS